jgi:aurora kinase A
MNPFKPASLLNDVKNRFLSLPRNATEGYEQEPTISDFECLKELGIGSFGKVYLVYHKVTKAKYALKTIDKLDEVNYEEKSYFAREIEIMYKLDHPNICKLYSHFEDDNYCYFLLQYIPKGSAYDIIPKNGKKQKNVKLVASVMKDLISAIYYLHNMNPPIIHRDIKPENILLDENSKAYLTDFGWSNYIRNNRTRSTICGTPLYLPPEMVTESGHNEKADIWCIGVLFFELMTGKVPFDGNDYTTVKYNIMKLNISWPSDIDPEVKDLISKILKKNPNERLSIEKILSHSFFTKYFPNAVKELIKPIERPMKVFVVSTDDPNTWSPVKKKN